MSANIRNGYVTCQAITKSDDTTYTPPLSGLYIGTSGDVAVILEGDASAVTIPDLAAGVIHNLRVSKVMSTNTEPSDIVGFR